MYTVDWVFEQLDTIGKHIVDLNFDDSMLSLVKTKISELSAQLAVHNSLTTTIKQLQESNQSKNRQSRTEKFIKVVYGNSTHPNFIDTPRWERLRSLDCATFLLIAASYTPVDVSKLGRTEFHYLVETAPKYLLIEDLPSKWMFRKEFQLAVAAQAELEGISQFKRKYHDLERSAPDVQEPRKRSRTGSQFDDETRALDKPRSALLEETIPSGGQCPPSSTEQESGIVNLTGRESSTGLGIETAFEVTPEVFEKIWKELSMEFQSIILTIPAEDRVGSIVHSIPRRRAIMCGKEYNLTKIVLPTSA